MSKDKIQTVLHFPIPMNLSLLKSFLGLANYFRQFVPMHSTMVKPMHDMIDHTAAKRSREFGLKRVRLLFPDVH